MEKIFRKLRRKGFTFVELLIVLVILGALYVTLMLFFGDSVTTTKANRIANNLSIVKNAVMLYSITEIKPSLEKFIENAKTYLGDTALTDCETTVMYSYNVSYDVLSTDQDVWYVKATFTNDPDSLDIKGKLVGLSSDLTLLDDNYESYSGNGDIVKLRIQ